MHVHTSAVAFVAFLAMLIIAQFLERLVVLKYPETTIGKALAVLN